MPSNTPIPLPQVDIDEPVAVIPTASVAPPEGQPDGERINIFTIAPKKGVLSSSALAGDLRQRARERPLTCAAIAFSLGFVLARALR